ncbi:MAG: lysophospholipid acyltransferase family protein [Terrimicrobiaceae bacterium]|nr:1-acyl-sn-glycerol-3-phosphate acyltransferase [Terrimicrobiaceae bacterium]
MSTLRASSRANEADGYQGRAFPPGSYFRQMLATALFFVLGIIGSPVFWILHEIAGRRIPAQVGQKLVRWLFRIFVSSMKALGMLRLEVRGFEVLEDMRGTVIVSNHPALLDAVFLIANLPPAACVMRADLLRNPALCGSALLAGYVTNDSGPAFVRQGIEKIRAGGNLLIFPEGTRTIDPPLNRFKHGFAMVAARSRAAVQTVVIEYRGAHLSKGVSLFSPAEAPLHFILRAGERFLPSPAESPAGFSQRVEAWFRAELEKPSPDL